MRYAHPHTIENGQGESLTFVGVREDARGEYMEVRNVVQPGAGPPMHTHHRQEETLTVVQGTLGYELEGQPAQFAGPGETVTFLPGQAHRFWAEGDAPLECTGEVRPPENIEYFLTEIYRSTRERGDRPDDFEAAYLLHRYRGEFAMHEIPAPVQSLVFPVLRLLGGLLGKYERYADAPEPFG